MWRHGEETSDDEKDLWGDVLCVFHRMLMLSFDLYLNEICLVIQH